MDNFQYIKCYWKYIDDEINKDNDFFAEIISKEEFERVITCNIYDGNIKFPKCVR